MAAQEEEEKKLDHRAVIIVDYENERMKYLLMRIMKALRANSFDLYEIQAEGRNNVKQAE